MIYDSSTAPHLKPWLIRTLEPICDAEPGALADYILALLKHNVPEQEMRKELVVQLDEFLEKECGPFVDTLFTVLRTKSYLPYAPPPSPKPTVDNGIPIPLDFITPPPAELSSDRGRKRSIEADDRNEHPAKGPRVNSEGQFSRYGNGGGRSTGRWEGRGEGGRGDEYMNGGVDGFDGQRPGGGPYMNGGRRQQGYHPPEQKRGICRDYYNHGYCARGAMCKYSHGEDAVVPGQLYPMAPGMPFLPIFPGAMPFGPGAGYDPHDSRIDMRLPRQQRLPVMSRTQQEGNAPSGELPVIQDLTPFMPQEPAQSTPPLHAGSQPSPQEASMMMNSDQPPPSHSPQQMDTSYIQPPYPGMQPMPYMPVQPLQPDADLRPTGHQGGYRGRGRGRGVFNGEAHNFRPERRSDKTLVVEKIPEDKLSLEQVNEWFKRFGTVTNVAIDKMGGKALVSFATNEEARAAWKSEDAVFNNRFVKVFWHRPMEGQGQLGAKMLAASAPLVANMTTKPTPAADATAGTSTSTIGAPAISRKASLNATSSSSPTASALAAKRQLLEQQITEQKSLMASLDSATPEEKKTIMARLRKVGEEMTTTSAEISAISSKKPTPTPVPKPPFDEREKKEREKLDKELEMHSVTAIPTSTSTVSEKAETAEELKADKELEMHSVTAIPTSTSTVSEKAETAEELKAKLEKLKAEAASLGLSTDSSEHHAGGSTYPYRGGYRGRPRGARGYGFRGAPRGGPPRFNMTLDNRPKKLLLKGVKSENIQSVRDWYETTGLLESVDMVEDGSVIVVFKTRAAAEQGLAKGQSIPTVGEVQISWHTGKSSVSGSGSTSSKKGSNTSPMERDENRAHSPDVEEEMVARGWGGDDDGDGMGML